MKTLNSTHSPGIIAQAVAPVARVWQGFQDKVAKLLGLKNAGTASAVVGVAGLTTMAVAGILGPIGPAVYGAGLTVAGVGGAGLVENAVTKKLSRLDGKGTTSKH
ncbi:hypothetical protein KBB89_02175 [Candidatus Gracilibacteria bacterium]|nr:hypothetical protein [Candidatus Gracilibacteria bacterium]